MAILWKRQIQGVCNSARIVFTQCMAYNESVQKCRSISHYMEYTHVSVKSNLWKHGLTTYGLSTGAFL